MLIGKLLEADHVPKIGNLYSMAQGDVVLISSVSMVSEIYICECFVLRQQKIFFKSEFLLDSRGLREPDYHWRKYCKYVEAE